MENCHSIHDINMLQVHLVWITQYRYHVLQGDIHLRCRDILRQVCNSIDIRLSKE
jgi:putative transposase